jgi:hypothetical protein
MECRTVGSTINSWASNTLSAVESAGPGIYDLVAYSDVYRSVIAKTSAFVYHTNYTPPAGFVGSEFYVGEQAPPEGSNGTYQNGGLVGCGIAQGKQPGPPCIYVFEVSSLAPNIYLR